MSKFNCEAKAKLGEPKFTLLGRDKAAAQAIRFWALERQKRGLNRADDEQIIETYKVALDIEAYAAGPAYKEAVLKMHEEAGSDLI